VWSIALRSGAAADDALSVSRTSLQVQEQSGTPAIPDRRRGGRRRFRRRGGGVYLPLAERNALAVAAAVLWATLAVVLALPWISDLARSVTMPVAITIVVGIAIVPGYLNAHLLVSLSLDRPPPLERTPTANPLPAVTILVAAFNEEQRIANSLRSILAQEYSGRLEVVVIDDGSTDHTASTVAAMARDDARLRLVTTTHAGKAGALNLGLLVATTPLVATCDADTLLIPDAVRHAVERLERSPSDTVAVAGSVMVRNSRDNWLTAMQTWDYLLGIASVKRQQSLMRGTLVAQGAFSLYRTDALRAAGGWPDMIGEDIVLTWTMLEQGGRTTYEPTAVAFTDAPNTLRGLVRQRRRWARGMIEGLRLHGARLLRSHRLFAHAVGANFLFPLLDLTFTLAFPAGLVLAATGNFMIVGPMTAAVLPLNAAIICVLYRKQHHVFTALGLRIRRHRLGLLAYFLGYQLLLSPVSLIGYVAETFHAPRRW
jgi:poly-beta-1,6-N-acetyl-D-glucosamine synthase